MVPARPVIPTSEPRLERLTVYCADPGVRYEELSKEWVADGWTVMLAIPEYTPPYGVTVIFLRPLTVVQ